MATVYTYQPNSAVDVKVRKVIGANKVPTEITTTANRDVTSFRLSNAANTGAKTYAKFWNAAATPTQDSTAPDMIIPVGPGVVSNLTFVEGLLGTFWSSGIFLGATATKASANTSAEVQADPAVLVDATVEHGA